MEDYIYVGKIVNTHGLKGEIRILSDFDYKDKVWVKTGTLSGVSGLAGYVKAKNDKEYVFSILIQNFVQDSATVKALEDEIVKAIAEIE